MQRARVERHRITPRAHRASTTCRRQRLPARHRRGSATRLASALGLADVVADAHRVDRVQRAARTTRGRRRETRHQDARALVGHLQVASGVKDGRLVEVSAEACGVARGSDADPGSARRRDRSRARRRPRGRRCAPLSSVTIAAAAGLAHRRAYELDDAAVDRRGRARAARSSDQRLARRRQQAVADDDLLGRRLDAHRRRRRRSARRARCRGSGSRSPAFRRVSCDEPLARAVDEPQVARLRIEPDGVDDVALAAHDALVAAGDDLGRVGEARRARDQRARQERLDVARRNGRDRLRLERRNANLAATAAPCSRASVELRRGRRRRSRMMTSPG